jgi:hypothetical protein
VPELVRWYKYRWKTHRAIVGDNEQDAYARIMQAAPRFITERRKRATKRVRGEYQQVRTALLREYPTAMLIAHKEGAAYVALVPLRADKVFVTEVTYSAYLKRVVDVEPWKTVDGRYKTWDVFYTTPEWDGWNRYANRNDHITDPEVWKLAPQVIEQAMRLTEYGEILAVTFDPENEAFHGYYLKKPAILPPADRLLTGELQQEEIALIEFPWRRDQWNIVSIPKGSYTRYSCDWPTEGYPWNAGHYRKTRGHFNKVAQESKVMLFWIKEKVDQVVEMHNKVRETQRQRDEARAPIWKMLRFIEQDWRAAREAARYADFLREYGKPELWEGHKKTLPELKYTAPGWLWPVLLRQVEQGREVVGKYLGELAEGVNDVGQFADIVVRTE